MMAADAWPLTGSMARFDDLDEYKSRLLCGSEPAIPRMSDVPIRLPIPQPAKKGSIYEIQQNAAVKSFASAE
jgi:hypothetical protein